MTHTKELSGELERSLYVLLVYLLVVDCKTY